MRNCWSFRPESSRRIKPLQGHKLSEKEKEEFRGSSASTWGARVMDWLILKAKRIEVTGRKLQEIFSFQFVHHSTCQPLRSRISGLSVFYDACSTDFYDAEQKIGIGCLLLVMILPEWVQDLNFIHSAHCYLSGLFSSGVTRHFEKYPNLLLLPRVR